MKKLLSILTLLVVAVTGAWADEDPTLSIGATEQTSATFLKDYETEGITISSTASWSSGAVQLGNTPSGETAYNSHYLQIAANASIAKVSFLMSGNGSNKKLQAPAFGWEETPASNQADTYYLPDEQTTTANSYAAAKWFDYDFSGYDVKFIRVYRATKNISSTDPEYTGSSTVLGNGNTIKIYGIKVWLKALAPTITAQPQGAAYVTGYAAAAMHVAATASAGTLSYQWYRNTTATNTGGTPISGATTASYAPSTDVAGIFYYYCVVTDANGSTPSAVATITVSAASAPTINVSGAPTEPVKVGTAVTLTAEMTGVPAPTIKWFSNTTASTSGGTVITGATEETYSPSTETAGTYYYYAQAVNTEGNALSAVQTIVVQEQVIKPTITPGSKHFTSSVTMTASSKTEDASFKYSIDGGANWTDLPNEGVEFTETKTVQVKATKTGYIESDVATATYTKYTPTELATISEATTWDFANLNGGVQYPADDLNTEFVYTDIEEVSVKEGKTFNTGALAFMGEYPLRSGKAATQNGTLHFKTTVSGAITVTFSDTGNSGDAPKRYLNVNGVNSEYYTQRTGSGNDKQSDKVVAVPAGDVYITGMGEDGTTPRAIMVYKVVFTPDVPVEVTSAEWASTTTPNYAVEFGEGAKAYIATSSEGDKIKLTQINDAPAKTAIIVNAPTGTYKLIKKTTAKSDVTGNMLKSKTANDETAAVGDYALGTWIDGGNTVVGFGKLNAAGVANMTDDKAFIPAYLLANAVDFLPFVIGDEENETTSISEELRVKSEESSAYNLAGQKVGKDYKGIVIVNGKKFVRK